MDNFSGTRHLMAQTVLFFSNPLFAWLAVAVCCLAMGITGDVSVNMISLAILIIVHVTCGLIQSNANQKMDDLYMRAKSDVGPNGCKVCNKEPNVVYLENADMFYVRCDTCSTQTVMRNTVEEAIRDWDSLNEDINQEANL